MKYISELYETNPTKDYEPELIEAKEVECSITDLVQTVLEVHDMPLDADCLTVHSAGEITIISIPEGDDIEQFLGYFRVVQVGYFDDNKSSKVNESN